MDKIWAAAVDLPVIVQGALGSALFAFAIWAWNLAARHLSSVREGSCTTSDITSTPGYRICMPTIRLNCAPSAMR